MPDSRIKKRPAFKQMAFETAVRNPERYLGILKAVVSFEGRKLDDDCLLEIVSTLYLTGEVSSDKVLVTEGSTLDDIKVAVVEVNSSRKADGGFPEGYPSRFWTYMRTLSELGFVYAEYNEIFRLSEIAKRLVDGRLDEQEAFSIQALKYNRKSPYRNVSNDYNFYRLTLEVLLALRKEGKKLSYEQFIVLMFNKTGQAKETLDILNENSFSDEQQAFAFVTTHYGNTNKFQTVTRDYPDVVRRVMIISGFVTIRYSGKKFIEINESKLNYILSLLKIDFTLLEEEKTDAYKYFVKLDSKNDEFLALVETYRKVDSIDGEEYANKIHEIIALYSIDEPKILQCIKDIDSRSSSVIPEFNEIPAPLKLEFYISILIALKYKSEFAIKPNYKADHIGKPYSHAPGNYGDIDVYSTSTYWLIEVTLIRNKAQQLNNETTSVIRHLNSDVKFKDYTTKYLSFVAPVIHEDTKGFFDIASVQNQVAGKRINIKPYDTESFVAVTLNKENFADMESYTNDVFSSFRKILS